MNKTIFQIRDDNRKKFKAILKKLDFEYIGKDGHYGMYELKKPHITVYVHPEDNTSVVYWKNERDNIQSVTYFQYADALAKVAELMIPKFQIGC